MEPLFGSIKKICISHCLSHWTHALRTIIIIRKKKKWKKKNESSSSVSHSVLFPSASRDLYQSTSLNPKRSLIEWSTKLENEHFNSKRMRKRKIRNVREFTYLWNSPNWGGNNISNQIKEEVMKKKKNRNIYKEKRKIAVDFCEKAVERADSGKMMKTAQTH